MGYRLEVFQRETTCGWVQWKRTCCSSCTSWVLHKSQAGEVLWVQVTVSICIVGTKSEASHAPNNAARKIKKHVSRKSVWQMCDQGPPGREGAPLMVTYLKWSVCRCALVDLYQKKVSNNPSASPWGPQQNDRDQWIHTSAAFPWTSRIVWDHPYQTGCGMTNNHRTVSSVACQHVRSFSQWSAVEFCGWYRVRSSFPPS